MRRALALILLAIAGLVLHSDTRGQSSGGPYSIPAQVVAAGGGRATGGAFELEGTIGQHAVGPVARAVGVDLIPGFRRMGPVDDGVFDDGFEDI